MDEFPDEYVWYDGIESGTLINKEHPDICSSVFQVLQSLVEGCSNSIICRPVGPVSKLMGVKGRWEAGFNMPEYQSLLTRCNNRSKGNIDCLQQASSGPG